MRQPYGRAIASTVTLPHPQWWCRHGFLVVVQDVRGQGDSQGSLLASRRKPMTPPTRSTGCVDCRSQWSHWPLWLLLPRPDPTTGTGGVSTARLHRTSHVRAGRTQSLELRGEAHWWHLGLGWGLQLAALQARRRGEQSSWEEIRRSLEDGSYLEMAYAS